MKTYDRNIASLALTFAALLSLPVIHLARADSFDNTGSMNYGRYGHSATLLSNGKVLVVSGWNDLATAELYDPSAGTWATTGSLSPWRFGGAAVLLPNGKVLLAGGYYNGSALSSAELYDPSTGTWSATGSMNNNRSVPVGTLLDNGKVLVFGPGTSAELYDPSAGTWSTTGSKNAAGGTATLLLNGKVLAAGTGSGSGAELYDPSAGTWSTTGSLNTGRVGHTATLLPNGKVLIAGGYYFTSSAELYNPATGTWSATGSLNTQRYLHTATLLPSGKVLVAGGEDGSQTIDSAELYSPWAGTWSTTDSLNTLRNTHTATLLLNGKVLIAGGYEGDSSPHTSAEFFTSFTAHTISWLFPVEYENQDYLGSLSDDSAGSGVTYWPNQNTYLVLDNNPTRLREFSRPGTYLRTITLGSFGDPEDIHWISGNTFVIAKEKNTSSIDELVVIDLPTGSSDTTVNISSATRRLQIDSTFTSVNNKGIEAVALVGSDFYFATEQAVSSPANTWKVWKVANSGSGTVSVTPTAVFSLTDLVASRATDISGMATDGIYLYLLSDEGVTSPRGRVLIMTTGGQLIADNLLPDFTGGGTWQQAEGIELFMDSGEVKILLTGEKASGTGVDFMVLSE